MRKLVLLVIFSIFPFGCASDGYRPGIQGVRDVPQQVSYIDSAGNSHFVDPPAIWTDR